MDWTISDREVTARKPHTCIWCGEQIAKGENYRDVSGKYNGDFQVNKYHWECSTASLEALHKHDVREFEPHEFYRGLSLPRDERLENYPELAANPWYIHNLRREKRG